MICSRTVSMVKRRPAAGVASTSKTCPVSVQGPQVKSGVGVAVGAPGVGVAVAGAPVSVGVAVIVLVLVGGNVPVGTRVCVGVRVGTVGVRVGVGMVGVFVGV